MKLDGARSSILSMKTRYPESSVPCYLWKPSDDILKTSKRAAMNYNKEYCNSLQLNKEYCNSLQLNKEYCNSLQLFSMFLICRLMVSRDNKEHSIRDTWFS